jgi:transcription elongation factor GreB
MSKAFVKEESTEEADEDREDEPVGRSHHITPEGFDTLRAELSRLWKVDRPRVTEEVSAAAAQGDRSENAEYIYGKKKLREIDRRIRFLTKRLDKLVVVREPPKDRNKVFFGAWVDLVDEDEKALSYRIVGPDEFDLNARKISMDSPVAKALLGKSVGEIVTVDRPKGKVDLEIVGVRYLAG